jgi:NADPH:quinone reductase-like Zn-dependent oxidoreductase
MKAVVYSKKGSPEKLVYCDVDQPVPTDSEVLIKVHAVAVNAADYRSMKMGIIPKRKIFGADVAGRIEAVGKSINHFKPGDEVIGDLAGFGFGGFAEYVTAPEKALVIKPAAISMEEGSTLPMAALTALQALRDKGNIQAGQKVLIIGCAGGVGTFAVQLARYFRAEVTGVCSNQNVQQTISLGADHVIDYSKEDFMKSKTSYDLILAINGNYSLRACKKKLAPGGIYVMIGGSLSQIFKSLLFGWLMSFGSKKMRSLAAKPNKYDLGLITRLAAEGLIKPLIDRHYSLERTAEAMSYMGQGHARGKVVIIVDKTNYQINHKI